MPSPRSGLKGTIGFIMPAMMILLLYSKDWTGPYGILYWRVYPIDGVDVFLLNGLGSPSICKLGYQQIHSSNLKNSVTEWPDLDLEARKFTAKILSEDMELNEHVAAATENPNPSPSSDVSEDLEQDLESKAEL
ncbi:hypothetical protein IGI04_028085 [Brassica rapa subsp. trilocularis]|uniref:Uncharacterized protein n=1 Tax=Brassica rapa subsp. trilocularis TaxID=1813537 RepID=A0ABQ7L0Y0_BRACM|nr:hypothetical protein IGI04_028085 [Brassica rapa subsp. trilocularis]